MRAPGQTPYTISPQRDPPPNPAEATTVSDDPREPEVRSSTDCTNRYELIMVAAKEARRLNDYYRIRNVEPKSRVTTEAIRRARQRGVRFTYTTPPPEPTDGDGPIADTGAADPS